MTPQNRLAHYKIQVTCHEQVTLAMIKKLVSEATLRFYLPGKPLDQVYFEPTAMIPHRGEFCFTMRYFGRSESLANMAVKEFEATFEHLDRIKWVKFGRKPAFRIQLSVTSHPQI